MLNINEIVTTVAMNAKNITSTLIGFVFITFILINHLSIDTLLSTFQDDQNLSFLNPSIWKL